MAALAVGLALSCPPGAPAEPGGESPTKDSGYLEELASVHWRHGGLPQAQSLFAEAAKAAKDSADKARLLGNAGRVAADRQQWGEAVGLFREAAGTAPDPDFKARFLEHVGLVHERERRFQEALAAYGEATKLPAKPLTLRAVRQRIVELERRNENLDAVLKRWEEAASAAPPDLNAVELLCVAYEGVRRDPGRAVRWMEKLQSLRPLDADEELRLARQNERAGNGERAAALYAKLAEKESPDKDSLLERLAMTYASMGRKEDALAAAKRLAERHPAGILAPRVTSSVYARAGDIPGAAAYLQEAIAKEGDRGLRIDLTFLLANLYRDARQYAPAEEWTRKLMEDRDPKVQTRSRRLLVQIYEEQGRISELKW